jgi:hypothetical protein
MMANNAASDFAIVAQPPRFKRYSEACEMIDFPTWLGLLRADAAKMRRSSALKAIPAMFLRVIHADEVQPKIEAIKAWAVGNPEGLLDDSASAVPATRVA